MTSKAAQLWFDTYIETGDDKSAVELAYPDIGANGKDRKQLITSRASQLKAKYADKIHEVLHKTLVGDSPRMVKALKGLALNAEGEVVQLSALKDWLDRAGFQPKQNEATIAIQVNINRDL